MSQKIPKNPFQFGLFTSKPHKKWAIISFCGVLLATGLDKLTVVVLRHLTDAIAVQPVVMETVWFWAIAYPLLFFFTETFIWRASGFSGMRWFTRARFTAYQSLYEYITLHSKEYFNNRFSGALANKMANAVDGTESIFIQLLWRFSPLILGLLWYIIFTWMSDPRLGFIIWTWSLIFFGLNIWFAKKLQPYSYCFAESLSDLKGSVVDSLSNISLVHESASLSGERAYIGKFITKQRDAIFSYWWRSEWILVVNGILIFLFMFLMIGSSVYLFQLHAVSIGVVVMVIAIVSDLLQQLFFLGQEMKEMAKHNGEAREGLKEILHPHSIVDAPNAVNVSFARGAIDIETIAFHYDKSAVFNNFSLSIPAGQKVGLVGRSGAGKSTFVSLLLRHFDIQQGDINIDGKSIYGVTLESLRRAIAFVPQDTSLFHRTIRENIRYSNSRATNKEVMLAAKFAQADVFIESLPKGYETLVGERGVKLSGGQRQRIAIARAFLKNAPILILDEATSSLDSESEHAIQLALEKLMKERTVIAIAHRLSTLKKMDRIVVINKGKIIEDGTPTDLMHRQGSIFKKLWEHQVKGFIVDE